MNIGISLERQFVANNSAIFVMILIFLSSCTTLNSQHCTEGSIRDPVSHKCVYLLVEKMPQYVSDASLPTDMMRQLAKKHFDIEDIPTVLELEYVVNEDGTVSAIRIYGKANDNLTPFEKYVIKAFSKLQNWQAGSHNGRNVNVLMRAKFIIDTFY